MQEQSNVLKVLLTVLFVTFISSFVVYNAFGFEIGVIFAICFSTACLSSGFAGLENIIISKK
ncbi:MAG: hypothetical protein Q8R17_00675 [bacterium]|nr:hypothetical protein [bacterium]